MKNVLFICPDNAVLGPLAEACMNRAGGGRWRAFSAGLAPASRIHPAVERILRLKGHPAGPLQTKAVELFTLPLAPVPDLLIGLDTEPRNRSFAWKPAPAQRRWHVEWDGTTTPARIDDLYARLWRTAAAFAAESASAEPMLTRQYA